MPRIHKISGYIYDPRDVVPAEALMTEAVNFEGGKWRHLHIQTANIESDEVMKALKNENCDLAYCEQNFNDAIPVFFSDRECLPGGKWKHFKTGKIVEVICVARDTENPDSYGVVYITPDGRVWNRPLWMFLSEVDHDKYPDATQKYRFEEVTE